MTGNQFHDGYGRSKLDFPEFSEMIGGNWNKKNSGLFD